MSTSTTIDVILQYLQRLCIHPLYFNHPKVVLPGPLNWIFCIRFYPTLIFIYGAARVGPSQCKYMSFPFFKLFGGFSLLLESKSKSSVWFPWIWTCSHCLSVQLHQLPNILYVPLNSYICILPILGNEKLSQLTAPTASNTFSFSLQRKHPIL